VLRARDAWLLLSDQRADAPPAQNTAGSISAAHYVQAGVQAPAPPREGFRLYHVHNVLSKVTNLRAHCLPFEGTLDFWVLMIITGINAWACVKGFLDANAKGMLFNLGGSTEVNLRLIAVVFAMVEAAPGLLFLW